VRAYVRDLRASGRVPASNIASRAVFAVLAVVAVLFVFGSTVIGVVGGMMTASGGGFSPFMIAPILVAVGVVAVLATALVRMFGARRASGGGASTASRGPTR
jgi:uncharacterized membrane protein